jgi:probable rRNA maturation factor
MEILLINQSKVKLNDSVIQALVDVICHKLIKTKSLKNVKKLQRNEISLVLLSVSKMKSLNYEFRQKNFATDVLSFAPASAESLGELIFCPVVLERQSKDHKHSFNHEFLYMLIHGILHLLGYDHEKSKKEALKMFTLQDRLFSQLTESKINLKLTHVNRSRN